MKWLAVLSGGLRRPRTSQKRCSRFYVLFAPWSLVQWFKVVSTFFVVFEIILAFFVPHLAAVSAPLAAFLGYISTVVVCYCLRARGGRLRLICPPLSELGLDGPEHEVYKCGFGCVGFLFGLSVCLANHVLQPHLSIGFAHASNYGWCAAFGCAMQGVYTLELEMTPQTLAHFVGAFLFVVGANGHREVTRPIFAYARGPLRQDLAIAVEYARTHFMDYGGMLILLFFIPLALEAFQAIRRRPLQSEHLHWWLQNLFGLIQWLLISAYAGYFASYAIDAYCCISGCQMNIPMRPSTVAFVVPVQLDKQTNGQMLFIHL